MYGLYFSPKKVILSPKVDFDLANSADSDEMPHYAAFHLCLHCLSNYPVFKELILIITPNNCYDF